MRSGAIMFAHPACMRPRVQSSTPEIKQNIVIGEDREGKNREGRPQPYEEIRPERTLTCPPVSVWDTT